MTNYVVEVKGVGYVSRAQLVQLNYPEPDLIMNLTTEKGLGGSLGRLWMTIITFGIIRYLKEEC